MVKPVCSVQLTGQAAKLPSDQAYRATPT